MEKGTRSKNKLASKSSQKPIAREFSAGGVVFKKIQNPNHKFQTLWLVRKQAIFKDSTYAKNTWNLPKGWLDDEKEGVPGPLARGEKKAKEEDLQETAIKEVKEEGGVEAEIVKKIGTIRFFFTSTRGKVLKFVTFYLMEWVRDLPEGHDQETKEVAWLSYEEARKRLAYKSEKEILDKAKELLDSGIQRNLV
ncbi:NUDIX domain-containing protein [Patescibacteria group bacterium]|nr:NUDIX domain-containing protein [Patescibacteria group bacterium]